MVHVLISGKVQNIGFRQFIKSNAIKLNLKGWVKNLPDSRVEAMITGEHKNIEQMILLCRKGPFLAEVKNVEIEEVEDRNFDSFEIVKD
jgi:acylphosphatase